MNPEHRSAAARSWLPDLGPERKLGVFLRLAEAVFLAVALSTTATAASLVGTTSVTDAIPSASRFYTHCANGYYWVTYDDGTTGPVIYSSPTGVTWTNQTSSGTFTYRPATTSEWAVRYSGNDVIAFARKPAGTGKFHRFYRNATLNSNGTVTWNAAEVDASGALNGQEQINALIAGGKPYYWVADGLPQTFGDEGMGNLLNNPTTPFFSPPGGVGPPAIYGETHGQFSAGAFHMAGGSDPTDFIVLRTTTLPTRTAGDMAHRLIAAKYSVSLNDYVDDWSWYNVSLNGCSACSTPTTGPYLGTYQITESLDTEVKAGTDVEAHLRFAAVRDTTGNIHAVYVNGNDNVVHYEKAAGFNDSWSQVSTDVTAATAVIDRVALTALANDNLLLYYSKSDAGIYARHWNGTSWGSEATVKPASGTPLQGALASMELAQSCNAGIAWVEGSSSPYSVMFSSQPTAVTLAAFDARGRDRAVELSWETASELDNLGFHLYRALSTNGPWTRITPSLIQGLGSSPEGKRYSWLDSGLSNGTTYFYRLEDVDRSGLATVHGPVSATPGAGLGTVLAPATPSAPVAELPPSPGAPGWQSYGEPSAGALRVLRSTPSSLTLELRTGGFYARAQEDGSSRLYVPGFFELTDPGLPQVPTRRAWVDMPAGSQARVASIAPSDTVAFRGLVVGNAGAPQAIVERGTYRAVFRRVQAQAPRRSLFPDALARVLETAFQGETKKAYLELAPLRVDVASGHVVLARTLVVRLVFQGRAAGERRRGGIQGRKEPSAGVPAAAPAGRILARLAARSQGLHAVSFESVTSAGSNGSLASSWLRLSRLGQAVAFHVGPQPDRFGPGSTLYFVADGPETAYGNETVYELAIGSGGVQMPLAGSARAARTLLPTLVTRRAFEQNTNYLPALLKARDPWLWDYGLLAANGRDYPFTLAVPSAAPGPAVLSVDLQGGSDAPKLDSDHEVRVFVNGVPVGGASWDGLNPYHFAASVDASILVEGVNTLRLENLDTTGAFDSSVFLDRFAVDYPRRLMADAGRLDGRAPSSGLVRAAGFPQGALLVDVTGSTPAWLRASATGGEIAFTAEAGKSYLAVSPEAVLRPEVRPAAPATLRTGSHQADWIVIAPKELLAAAEPLVAERESQGLAAMALSLEQIQDEFGYGERSPRMLRDFVAHAFHHWTAPSVRYVLLLGDASYDPKGFMPTATRKDLLPTPFVKSTFLWTASDPWLAAVNGDDAVPDLAIGRLSAGSLAEAEAAVGKILAFEASGQTLDGNAVLVADNPDLAGDFVANANDIASLLTGRQVERIFLTELGAGTRGAVLSAFDTGSSLVSYVGHGSQALWASESILRSIDVALLKPQPRQPLMLTMTCSNGYFISPWLNGIAERFVLEEDKGAIAAFSPSGLSLDEAAHLYHRALVQELQSRRHERLGDLVLAAQKDYADTGAFPELLSLYHLFADPALLIR